MLPIYKQLKVKEIEDNVFIGEMKIKGRKNFNIELLNDITDFFMFVFQQENHNNENRFFVLKGEEGSGIFNIGGDLSLFLGLLENKDILALQQYGRKCVDLIYKSMNAKNSNMTTVSIINGDAYGGGFESALACDIIIAEKGFNISLPEIRYGFFPGMGAFELLSKRVGFVKAKELIMSGKRYSTDELFELGIFDYLVEKGKGEEELLKVVKKERANQVTYNSLRKVFDKGYEVSYQDLIQTLDLWVDSILHISEHNKAQIKKVLRVQDKKAT